MTDKPVKLFLVVPPVIYARHPSIGVAYLSSYLKSRGHEVKCWDLNIEQVIYNDCDTHFWQVEENCYNYFQNHKSLFDEWVQKILDFQPQIVGFSVWESSEYFSMRMAGMIKKRNKDILVICGGPSCGYFGRRIINNPYVDIVVYREGEEVLAEAVELYIKNGTVDFLNGCLLKKNGEIIDCGLCQEISDLDSMPFPDFSDFPPEKYLFKNHVPISFSRGCAWRCTYCSTGIRWQKIRLRKPEMIYKEILYRLKQFKTLNRFEICDPAANQDLDLISQLCDLIITDGIKVELVGFAQIKSGMNSEYLRKMRKAGFITLQYGVESGSQRVLNSMGRGYTVEEAERIIKDSYYAGIGVGLNFIVGFPNEAEEDFNKTLQFVERVKNFVTNITPAAPCGIPHSYMLYHPEKFNIIFPKGDSNNWRTPDGSNTLEIRTKRKLDFDAFVRSLGVSYRDTAEDRAAYS